MGRRGRKRACRALGTGARVWRADGHAGRAGAGSGCRRARGRRQRRAGRAGVRGHADGRCRQLGEQARERGRGSARARQQARRADERACRGALAALRHDSLALRHGRGARPRHGQAAHDKATSARPVRAGWAYWARLGFCAL